MLSDILSSIIKPVLNQLYTWFIDVFSVCGINIVGFILCSYGLICIQRLLSNGAGNAPSLRAGNKNFHQTGWSANKQDSNSHVRRSN